MQSKSRISEKQKRLLRGPLSDEEKQKIRKLRSKGYSFREIKEKVGVSKNTVIKYSKNVKLTKEQKEILKRKVQDALIKARISHSLSKEQIQKKQTVRKLRFEGFSIREITRAVDFGISNNTIIKWTKDIELTKTQKDRFRKKHLDGLEKARDVRSLSKEQIQEIRNYRTQGFSLSEIQAMVGFKVTKNGIARHVKDIELTKAQKERLKKKAFDALTRARVARSLSSKQIQKPRDYRKKGFSLSEIQALVDFEVTRQGIARHTKDIELSIEQRQEIDERSTGRSEHITRIIFETIFNCEFPKGNPEWLVNNKGFRLHLDGFNKKLALAFEYQGKQHYQLHHLFHETMDDYKNQITNDLKKRDLCKQHGVTLIEIPFTVPYDQISDFVIIKCQKKGILIPESVKNIDFNEIIRKNYLRSEDLTHSQNQIDDYLSDIDVEKTHF